MDSTGQGALTREQIRGAKDIVIEAVFIPEWGGTIYIRGLMGCKRDAFEGSRIRLKDNKVEMVHDNTRARLVSMTACDELGQLLFTEDDVEWLGEKSASALDQAFEVAQRLSALRPVDLEQKVKNSGAALSVNSSSVSPSH
jgi:hypothetical protein